MSRILIWPADLKIVYLEQRFAPNVNNIPMLNLIDNFSYLLHLNIQYKHWCSQHFRHTKWIYFVWNCTEPKSNAKQKETDLHYSAWWLVLSFSLAWRPCCQTGGQQTLHGKELTRKEYKIPLAKISHISRAIWYKPVSASKWEMEGLNKPVSNGKSAGERGTGK